MAHAPQRDTTQKQQHRQRVDALSFLLCLSLFVASSSWSSFCRRARRLLLSHPLKNYAAPPRKLRSTASSCSCNDKGLDRFAF
jgi:hypothetical protein